ncbi:MAG: chromate efflux transporter [Gammaproteobacteria bacterium]|nr:chromate efflux transporter [Gammaproteobacteria bacterium]MBU1554461.1 chromate efflux transporter [Gammaproteobacteria bacterium]MBU2070715.1 chromate efflux transporter [Gammaproteobacteria bacterium]MBU2182706.1 chromate efflux transporter [Gammaproteobacteria bacterium]MBU2206052.1 chromate efflux transporter [Gammaproteobacteria bacterium]
MTAATKKPGFWAIFSIFLLLGLTSFGGPAAHIGYFRQQFVSKRRWLSDAEFASLLALCQFLPGPASSQLGMAIGLLQHKFRGALAAWLGFTLPSALLMLAFALSLTWWQQPLLNGVLHGLKLVAVAVVAQAIWAMAQSLCNSSRKALIMLLNAAIVLWQPGAIVQPLLILAAAVAGVMLLRHQPAAAGTALTGKPVSQRLALSCGLLFLILLIGLPVAAQLYPQPALQLVDIFYRTGALVFGGGHVVLPLLQAELVPAALVNADQFMAGYAAAQAVPGPLFSFAAFVGAVAQSGISPLHGGVLALLAIFLPSFLILSAVLPYWQRVSQQPTVRSAIAGVGAAVTGLLLATLYQPLVSSSILTPLDAALALLALIALQYLRLPPWLLVLAAVVMSSVLH